MAEKQPSLRERATAALQAQRDEKEARKKREGDCRIAAHRTRFVELAGVLGITLSPDALTLEAGSSLASLHYQTEQVSFRIYVDTVCVATSLIVTLHCPHCGREIPPFPVANLTDLGWAHELQADHEAWCLMDSKADTPDEHSNGDYEPMTPDQIAAYTALDAALVTYEAAGASAIDSIVKRDLDAAYGTEGVGR